jgi:o-succinylbenzoate---CoA ligase
MLRGVDLWRETCPLRDEAGSFLLLNPRMAEALREQVLAAEFPDLNDHVWLATSGTGGQLKLVALGRSALAASARAVNQHLEATAEDVWVNPLPMFHVGGLGMWWRANLAGGACFDVGAWDPWEFVRLCEKVDGTLSSLVPTQVHDLVGTGLRAPECLRAVVVGGGALDGRLLSAAADLGWPLLTSYGLTEAASQVATSVTAGEQPAWLPLLSHLEARTNDEGVLELRGPSLLTGWMTFKEGEAPQWEDLKVGGWFRTGDRVELRGRSLKILGRVDDLVKIRGELVDVAALERDLQRHVDAGAIFLRLIEDPRAGWALEVVAEDESALAQARAAADLFPPYVRPVTFLKAAIPRNAMGKPLLRRAGR